MKVNVYYEPAVNRYWIDLKAAWGISIMDKGVGLHQMTCTKPTARQLRQWKKQVKQYRSAPDETYAMEA